MPTHRQKLYRWRSELLKRYGCGHILVQAEDVPHARRLVVEAFPQWLKHERDYQWLAIQYGDTELGEQLNTQLQADNAAEPEEVTGCIWIDGSE